MNLCFYLCLLLAVLQSHSSGLSYISGDVASSQSPIEKESNDIFGTNIVRYGDKEAAETVDSKSKEISAPATDQLIHHVLPKGFEGDLQYFVSPLAWQRTTGQFKRSTKLSIDDSGNLPTTSGLSSYKFRSPVSSRKIYHFQKYISPEFITTGAPRKFKIIQNPIKTVYNEPSASQIKFLNSTQLSQKAIPTLPLDTTVEVTPKEASKNPQALREISYTPNKILDNKNLLTTGKINIPSYSIKHTRIFPNFENWGDVIHDSSKIIIKPKNYKQTDKPKKSKKSFLSSPSSVEIIGQNEGTQEPLTRDQSGRRITHFVDFQGTPQHTSHKYTPLLHYPSDSQPTKGKVITITQHENIIDAPETQFAHSFTTPAAPLNPSVRTKEWSSLPEEKSQSNWQLYSSPHSSFTFYSRPPGSISQGTMDSPKNVSRISEVNSPLNKKDDTNKPKKKSKIQWPLNEPSDFFSRTKLTSLNPRKKFLSNVILDGPPNNVTKISVTKQPSSSNPILGPVYHWSQKFSLPGFSDQTINTSLRKKTSPDQHGALLFPKQINNKPDSTNQWQKTILHLQGASQPPNEVNIIHHILNPESQQTSHLDGRQESPQQLEDYSQISKPLGKQQPSNKPLGTSVSQSTMQISGYPEKPRTIDLKQLSTPGQKEKTLAPNKLNNQPYILNPIQWKQVPIRAQGDFQSSDQVNSISHTLNPANQFQETKIHLYKMPESNGQIINNPDTINSAGEGHLTLNRPDGLPQSPMKFEIYSHISNPREGNRQKLLKRPHDTSVPQWKVNNIPVVFNTNGSEKNIFLHPHGISQSIVQISGKPDISKQIGNEQLSFPGQHGTFLLSGQETNNPGASKPLNQWQQGSIRAEVTPQSPSQINNIPEIFNPGEGQLLSVDQGEEPWSPQKLKSYFQISSSPSGNKKQPLNGPYGTLKTQRKVTNIEEKFNPPGNGKQPSLHHGITQSIVHLSEFPDKSKPIRSKPPSSTDQHGRSLFTPSQWKKETKPAEVTPQSPDKIFNISDTFNSTEEGQLPSVSPVGQPRSPPELKSYTQKSIYTVGNKEQTSKRPDEIHQPQRKTNNIPEIFNPIGNGKPTPLNPHQISQSIVHESRFPKKSKPSTQSQLPNNNRPDSLKPTSQWKHTPIHINGFFQSSAETGNIPGIFNPSANAQDKFTHPNFQTGPTQKFDSVSQVINSPVGDEKKPSNRPYGTSELQRNVNYIPEIFHQTGNGKEASPIPHGVVQSNTQGFGFSSISKPTGLPQMSSLGKQGKSIPQVQSKKQPDSFYPTSQRPQTQIHINGNDQSSAKIGNIQGKFNPSGNGQHKVTHPDEQPWSSQTYESNSQLSNSPDGHNTQPPNWQSGKSQPQGKANNNPQIFTSRNNRKPTSPNSHRFPQHLLQILGFSGTSNPTGTHQLPSPGQNRKIFPPGELSNQPGSLNPSSQWQPTPIHINGISQSQVQYGNIPGTLNPSANGQHKVTHLDEPPWSPQTYESYSQLSNSPDGHNPPPPNWQTGKYPPQGKPNNNPEIFTSRSNGEPTSPNPHRFPQHVLQIPGFSGSSNPTGTHQLPSPGQKRKTFSPVQSNTQPDSLKPTSQWQQNPTGINGISQSSTQIRNIPGTFNPSANGQHKLTHPDGQPKSPQSYESYSLITSSPFENRQQASNGPYGKSMPQRSVNNNLEIFHPNGNGKQTSQKLHDLSQSIMEEPGSPDISNPTGIPQLPSPGQKGRSFSPGQLKKQPNCWNPSSKWKQTAKHINGLSQSPNQIANTPGTFNPSANGQHPEVYTSRSNREPTSPNPHKFPQHVLQISGFSDTSNPTGVNQQPSPGQKEKTFSPRQLNTQPNILNPISQWQQNPIDINGISKIGQTGEIPGTFNPSTDGQHKLIHPDGKPRFPHFTFESYSQLSNSSVGNKQLPLNWQTGKSHPQGKANNPEINTSRRNGEPTSQNPHRFPQLLKQISGFFGSSNPTGIHQLPSPGQKAKTFFPGQLNTLPDSFNLARQWQQTPIDTDGISQSITHIGTTPGTFNPSANGQHKLSHPDGQPWNPQTYEIYSKLSNSPVGNKHQTPNWQTGKSQPQGKANNNPEIFTSRSDGEPTSLNPGRFPHHVLQISGFSSSSNPTGIHQLPSPGHKVKTFSPEHFSNQPDSLNPSSRWQQSPKHINGISQSPVEIGHIPELFNPSVKSQHILTHPNGQPWSPRAFESYSRLSNSPVLNKQQPLNWQTGKSQPQGKASNHPEVYTSTSNGEPTSPNPHKFPQHVLQISEFSGTSNPTGINQLPSQGQNEKAFSPGHFNNQPNGLKPTSQWQQTPIDTNGISQSITHIGKIPGTFNPSANSRHKLTHPNGQPWSPQTYESYSQLSNSPVGHKPQPSNWQTGRSQPQGKVNSNPEIFTSRSNVKPTIPNHHRFPQHVIHISGFSGTSNPIGLPQLTSPGQNGNTLFPGQLNTQANSPSSLPKQKPKPKNMIYLSPSQIGSIPGTFSSSSNGQYKLTLLDGQRWSPQIFKSYSHISNFPVGNNQQAANWETGKSQPQRVENNNPDIFTSRSNGEPTSTNPHRFPQHVLQISGFSGSSNPTSIHQLPSPGQEEKTFFPGQLNTKPDSLNVTSQWQQIPIHVNGISQSIAHIGEIPGTFNPSANGQRKLTYPNGEPKSPQTYESYSQLSSSPAGHKPQPSNWQTGRSQPQGKANSSPEIFTSRSNIKPTSPNPRFPQHTSGFSGTSNPIGLPQLTSPGQNGNTLSPVQLNTQANSLNPSSQSKQTPTHKNMIYFSPTQIGSIPGTFSSSSNSQQLTRPYGQPWSPQIFESCSHLSNVPVSYNQQPINWETGKSQPQRVENNNPDIFTSRSNGEPTSANSPRYPHHVLQLSGTSNPTGIHQLPSPGQNGNTFSPEPLSHQPDNFNPSSRWQQSPKHITRISQSPPETGHIPGTLNSSSKGQHGLTHPNGQLWNPHTYESYSQLSNSPVGNKQELPNWQTGKPQPQGKANNNPKIFTTRSKGKPTSLNPQRLPQNVLQISGFSDTSNPTGFPQLITPGQNEKTLFPEQLNKQPYSLNPSSRQQCPKHINGISQSPSEVGHIPGTFIPRAKSQHRLTPPDGQPWNHNTYESYSQLPYSPVGNKQQLPNRRTGKSQPQGKVNNNPEIFTSRSNGEPTSQNPQHLLQISGFSETSNPNVIPQLTSAGQKGRIFSPGQLNIQPQSLNPSSHLQHSPEHITRISQTPGEIANIPESFYPTANSRHKLTHPNGQPWSPQTYESYSQLSNSPVGHKPQPSNWQTGRSQPQGKANSNPEINTSRSNGESTSQNPQIFPQHFMQIFGFSGTSEPTGLSQLTSPGQIEKAFSPGHFNNQPNGLKPTIQWQQTPTRINGISQSSTQISNIPGSINTFSPEPLSHQPDSFNPSSRWQQSPKHITRICQSPPVTGHIPGTFNPSSMGQHGLTHPIGQPWNPHTYESYSQLSNSPVGNKQLPLNWQTGKSHPQGKANNPDINTSRSNGGPTSQNPHRFPHHVLQISKFLDTSNPTGFPQLISPGQNKKTLSPGEFNNQPDSLKRTIQWQQTPTHINIISKSSSPFGNIPDSYNPSVKGQYKSTHPGGQPWNPHTYEGNSQLSYFPVGNKQQPPNWQTGKSQPQGKGNNQQWQRTPIDINGISQSNAQTEQIPGKLNPSAIGQQKLIHPDGQPWNPHTYESYSQLSNSPVGNKQLPLNWQTGKSHPQGKANNPDINTSRSNGGPTSLNPGRFPHHVLQISGFSSSSNPTGIHQLPSPGHKVKTFSPEHFSNQPDSSNPSSRWQQSPKHINGISQSPVEIGHIPESFNPSVKSQHILTHPNGQPWSPRAFESYSRFSNYPVPNKQHPLNWQTGKSLPQGKASNHPEVYTSTSNGEPTSPNPHKFPQHVLQISGFSGTSNPTGINQLPSQGQNEKAFSPGHFNNQTNGLKPTSQWQQTPIDTNGISQSITHIGKIPGTFNPSANGQHKLTYADGETKSPQTYESYSQLSNSPVGNKPQPSNWQTGRSQPQGKANSNPEIFTSRSNGKPTTSNHHRFPQYVIHISGFSGTSNPIGFPQLTSPGKNGNTLFPGQLNTQANSPSSQSKQKPKPKNMIYLSPSQIGSIPGTFSSSSNGQHKLTLPDGQRWSPQIFKNYSHMSNFPVGNNQQAANWETGKSQPQRVENNNPDIFTSRSNGEPTSAKSHRFPHHVWQLSGTSNPTGVNQLPSQDQKGTTFSPGQLNIQPDSLNPSTQWKQSPIHINGISLSPTINGRIPGTFSRSANGQHKLTRPVGQLWSPQTYEGYSQTFQNPQGLTQSIVEFPGSPEISNPTGIHQLSSPGEKGQLNNQPDSKNPSSQWLQTSIRINKISPSPGHIHGTFNSSANGQHKVTRPDGQPWSPQTIEGYSQTSLNPQGLTQSIGEVPGSPEISNPTGIHQLSSPGENGKLNNQPDSKNPSSQWLQTSIRINKISPSPGHIHGTFNPSANGQHKVTRPDGQPWSPQTIEGYSQTSLNPQGLTQSIVEVPGSLEISNPTGIHQLSSPGENGQLNNKPDSKNPSSQWLQTSIRINKISPSPGHIHGTFNPSANGQHKVTRPDGQPWSPQTIEGYSQTFLNPQGLTQSIVEVPGSPEISNPTGIHQLSSPGDKGQLNNNPDSKNPSSQWLQTSIHINKISPSPGHIHGTFNPSANGQHKVTRPDGQPWSPQTIEGYSQTFLNPQGLTQSIVEVPGSPEISNPTGIHQLSSPGENGQLNNKPDSKNPSSQWLQTSIHINKISPSPGHIHGTFNPSANGQHKLTRPVGQPWSPKTYEGYSQTFLNPQGLTQSIVEVPGSPKISNPTGLHQLSSPVENGQLNNQPDSKNPSSQWLQTSIHINKISPSPGHIHGTFNPSANGQHKVTRPDGQPWSPQTYEGYSQTSLNPQRLTQSIVEVPGSPKISNPTGLHQLSSPVENGQLNNQPDSKNPSSQWLQTSIHINKISPSPGHIHGTFNPSANGQHKVTRPDGQPWSPQTYEGYSQTSLNPQRLTQSIVEVPGSLEISNPTGINQLSSPGENGQLNNNPDSKNPSSQWLQTSIHINKISPSPGHIHGTFNPSANGQHKVTRPDGQPWSPQTYEGYSQTSLNPHGLTQSIVEVPGSPEISNPTGIHQLSSPGENGQLNNQPDSKNPSSQWLQTSIRINKISPSPGHIHGTFNPSANGQHKVTRPDGQLWSPQTIENDSQLSNFPVGNKLQLPNWQTEKSQPQGKANNNPEIFISRSNGKPTSLNPTRFPQHVIQISGYSGTSNPTGFPQSQLSNSPVGNEQPLPNWPNEKSLPEGKANNQPEVFNPHINGKQTSPSPHGLSGTNTHLSEFHDGPTLPFGQVNLYPDKPKPIIQWQQTPTSGHGTDPINSAGQGHLSILPNGNQRSLQQVESYSQKSIPSSIRPSIHRNPNSYLSVQGYPYISNPSSGQPAGKSLKNPLNPLQSSNIPGGKMIHSSLNPLGISESFKHVTGFPEISKPHTPLLKVFSSDVSVPSRFGHLPSLTQTTSQTYASFNGFPVGTDPNKLNHQRPPSTSWSSQWSVNDIPDESLLNRLNQLSLHVSSPSQAQLQKNRPPVVSNLSELKTQRLLKPFISSNPQGLGSLLLYNSTSPRREPKLVSSKQTLISSSNPKPINNSLLIYKIPLGDEIEKVTSTQRLVLSSPFTTTQTLKNPKSTYKIVLDLPNKVTSIKRNLSLPLTTEPQRYKFKTIKYPSPRKVTSTQRLVSPFKTKTPKIFDESLKPYSIPLESNSKKINFIQRHTTSPSITQSPPYLIEKSHAPEYGKISSIHKLQLPSVSSSTVGLNDLEEPHVFTFRHPGKVTYTKRVIMSSTSPVLDKLNVLQKNYGIPLIKISKKPSSIERFESISKPSISQTLEVLPKTTITIGKSEKDNSIEGFPSSIASSVPQNENLPVRFGITSEGHPRKFTSFQRLLSMPITPEPLTVISGTKKYTGQFFPNNKISVTETNLDKPVLDGVETGPFVVQQSVNLPKKPGLSFDEPPQHIIPNAKLLSVTNKPSLLEIRKTSLPAFDKVSSPPKSTSKVSFSASDNLLEPSLEPASNQVEKKLEKVSKFKAIKPPKQNPVSLSDRPSDLKQVSVPNKVLQLLSSQLSSLSPKEKVSKPLASELFSTIVNTEAKPKSPIGELKSETIIKAFPIKDTHSPPQKSSNTNPNISNYSKPVFNMGLSIDQIRRTQSTPSPKVSKIIKPKSGFFIVQNQPAQDGPEVPKYNIISPRPSSTNNLNKQQPENNLLPNTPFSEYERSEVNDKRGNLDAHIPDNFKVPLLIKKNYYGVADVKPDVVQELSKPIKSFRLRRINPSLNDIIFNKVKYLKPVVIEEPTKTTLKIPLRGDAKLIGSDNPIHEEIKELPNSVTSVNQILEIPSITDENLNELGDTIPGEVNDHPNAIKTFSQRLSIVKSNPGQIKKFTKPLKSFDEKTEMESGVDFTKPGRVQITKGSKDVNEWSPSNEDIDLIQGGIAPHAETQTKPISIKSLTQGFNIPSSSDVYLNEVDDTKSGEIKELPKPLKPYIKLLGNPSRVSENSIHVISVKPEMTKRQKNQNLEIPSINNGNLNVDDDGSPEEAQISSMPLKSFKEGLALPFRNNINVNRIVKFSPETDQRPSKPINSYNEIFQASLPNEISINKVRNDKYGQIETNSKQIKPLKENLGFSTNDNHDLFENGDNPDKLQKATKEVKFITQRLKTPKSFDVNPNAVDNTKSTGFHKSNSVPVRTLLSIVQPHPETQLLSNENTENIEPISQKNTGDKNTVNKFSTGETQLKTIPTFSSVSANGLTKLIGSNPSSVPELSGKTKTVVTKVVKKRKIIRRKVKSQTSTTKKVQHVIKVYKKPTPQ